MKNKQTSQQKLSRLKQERQEKEQLHQEVEHTLQQRTTELKQAKRSKLLKLLNKEKIKQIIRTTGAYTLGKRNRKNLYSKTYKQKDATNRLKGYTTALYEKGFTDKALIDLKDQLEVTTNRYLKRAIAWELGLWYANLETETGAIQAIPYLELAEKGENTIYVQRRIAILKAECYIRIQDTNEAKQLLINQLEKEAHPDLYMALANTETDVEAKLSWVNHVNHMYDIEPIHFCSDDENVGYDDLRTAHIPNKLEGPKISVILPAFNSEVGIRIAIESILNQSYQQIELIIVDDCSTDNTFEVAKRYQEIDERVLVLQNEVNSGPYVARNLGLEHATGEYVTINDADDWSHGRKLEIQANYLINHPEVIANTSQLARLTETLQFYRRGTPGKYIFSNMSSLLFRREEVMEKIGYWDTVRFAADGEFKRRLLLAFGKAAVVDLKTGPLSLPRQTEGSLTGVSAFGYNGFFMGVRKEYVESFTHYHQTASSLYYPVKQANRLFPVPEPMHPQGKRVKRHVDITMVADFTTLDDTAVTSLENEIQKNKQLGLKTALVQMYRYDIQKIAPFHTKVRNLIDGNEVQVVVYGEEIETNILIIRSPAVLMEEQK